MRPLAFAALLAIVSCTSYGLEHEMADLRAEIQALERDIPPEAPLWVTEGDNAFERHLEDYTARVPDFIYNHIVEKLATGTDREFAGLAKGEFDVEACFGDPAKHRGQFWRARGKIATLKAQTADAASGVREMHSGLVWNGDRPILFHCVEKPEVLMLHEDFVEFVGVFVKIIRYHTKDGTPIDAPFFLAKTLRKYY
jgi:hypothetical protein